MGATAFAVADYFYAGMTASEIAAAGGTAYAGTAAAAGGATAGGAAAGGWGAVGQTVGTAVATGLVSKALAPGAPEVKAPLGMPDPLAQEAARQKQIAETTQRRGRASTVLTQPDTQKLGG